MIKLNVLAFEEDGVWIAQCIEHDICVSAPKLLLLPKYLAREITANLLVNQKVGRSGLEGIRPAPEAVRLAFEATKATFFPGSHLVRPDVTIDEIRLVEHLAA